ncbi:MAG: SRPBCC family protein [Salinivirgaceae bacterium]
MEIESRIGTIPSNQQKAFSLLSDFRNLDKFMPRDQVSDLISDVDSCHFNIAKIGKFGMRIVERVPNNQVKITNTESVPFSFTLWFYLTPISDNKTSVKISLKADLNPIFKLVAQKPLTNFIEALIGKLETIEP